MIKKLFFILIFFHFLSFSQQGKSIIYLNDGSVINAYVKNFYSDSIGGVKKSNINRLIINEKGSKKTLVYERVLTNKHKKPSLLKVVLEGKNAQLYSSPIFKKDKLGQLVIPDRPRAYAYFAKKENEKVAMLIAYRDGSKFKTNGSLFFSDCPNLALLIKKGQINFTNKIRAFNYYEQNCN